MRYQYDREILKEFCCFLTSYLEDIVSGSGLWTAFRKSCLDITGRKIPFTICSADYQDDEVNLEDVHFLTWYYFQSLDLTKLIHWSSALLIDLSHSCTIVLDQHWEVVPENPKLCSYYQLSPDEDDHLVCRNLLDNIFFKSYLFAPDMKPRLDDALEPVFQRSIPEDVMNHLAYEAHVNLIFTARSQLLALSASEWAVRILGRDHLASRLFDNMSSRITGSFFLTSVEEDGLHFRHLASGKDFALKEESFREDHHLERQLRHVFHMSIIKWNGRWELSGVMMDQGPASLKIINEHKNSVERQAEMSPLHTNDPQNADHFSNQHDAFEQVCGHRDIAFVESTQLEDLFATIVQKTNEMNPLARSAPKKPNITLVKELTERSEIVVLFYNPKAGMEIYPGLESAFPLDHNPYFDSARSLNATQNIILSEMVSTEIAHYFLEHCLPRLDVNLAGLEELLENDADFILRFWKADHYITDPKIILV